MGQEILVAPDDPQQNKELHTKVQIFIELALFILDLMDTGSAALNIQLSIICERSELY